MDAGWEYSNSRGLSKSAINNSEQFAIYLRVFVLLESQLEFLKKLLHWISTQTYSMMHKESQLIIEINMMSYELTNIFKRFAQEISQVNYNQFHMASFDIKSLFTNIPIKGKCNIILDKLFPLPDSVFDGFSRASFSEILDLCTKNNLFLFNN